MLYDYQQRPPRQHRIARQQRPKHLQYLASHDVQHYAGPILSDDETKPIGSTIVIEAEHLGAARAFAANDPYTVAGLFAEVNVHPFKQVIPESGS